MKLLFSIALLFLLISCEKDKTTPSCTGVSMIGERDVFVGTWRWYSTRMEQWFDIGPSNFYDVTPQSEGFEYYFTVSSSGLFKEYRNDTLIHDHILSEVEFEDFLGNTSNMTLIIDCSTSNLDIRHLANNVTNDSIHSSTHPLKIDDQENHLKSHRNFFVKQ